MAIGFQRQQTSSLRIRYRVANDLETSVEDALIGLEFLRQQGVIHVVLVGYGAGGSVAIQAGVMAADVRGVAVLAGQSYGTAAVAELAPRPLLLVAGEKDTTLPPECSEYMYQNAGEPKRLEVLPCDHSFDAAAPALQSLLAAWIGEILESVKS